jgi:hypothetical protein
MLIFIFNFSSQNIEMAYILLGYMGAIAFPFVFFILYSFGAFLEKKEKSKKKNLSNNTLFLSFLLSFPMSFFIAWVLLIFLQY